MKYTITILALLIANISNAASFKIIKNVDAIILYKFDKMNQTYVCNADVCYLNDVAYPFGSWYALSHKYDEISAGDISVDCKKVYDFYKKVFIGKEPQAQSVKYFADSVFYDTSNSVRTHYGGQLYVNKFSKKEQKNTIYISFKVHGDFVILTNDNKNCMSCSSLAESYSMAKKNSEEIVLLKGYGYTKLNSRDINKLNLTPIKAFNFKYVYTDHCP